MRYLFTAFTPEISGHTLTIADEFRQEWGESPLTRGLLVNINVHSKDKRLRGISFGTFINQILDALFGAGVITDYRPGTLLSVSMMVSEEGEQVGAFVTVEGYK